ncbi:MAG: J domain-containing protein [Proteobacteria bacterium]|nr:J domain-containing protein [Pseudomonadota bacterium]
MTLTRLAGFPYTGFPEEVRQAMSGRRSDQSQGDTPRDPTLARAYEALDLPYGASMVQVAARYRDYLAKSHPDLHVGDADRYIDAWELTRLLTEAYEKVQEAWRRFGPQPENLPRTDELTRAYEALDLPYGASMEQVTRRWREYLKKSHPDLHTDRPELLEDANKLTRLLTDAHGRIKTAWDRGEL